LVWKETSSYKLITTMLIYCMKIIFAVCDCWLEKYEVYPDNAAKTYQGYPNVLGLPSGNRVTQNLISV